LPYSKDIYWEDTLRGKAPEYYFKITWKFTSRNESDNKRGTDSFEARPLNKFNMNI
jgi:hypothetical protein